MPPAPYVPHIELILGALRVNRERLASRAKIAVDARLLRALIQTLAATQPFDPAFYRATYPDIDSAFEAGLIPDLHQHFIDSGFIEGRFGAAPEVDEAFYNESYPDIAEAVRAGEIASGAVHYLESGASEGRVPAAALRDVIDGWMAILRDEGGR